MFSAKSPIRMTEAACTLERLFGSRIRPSTFSKLNNRDDCNFRSIHPSFTADDVTIRVICPLSARIVE